jgi:hypothetical protein
MSETPNHTPQTGGNASLFGRLSRRQLLLAAAGGTMAAVAGGAGGLAWLRGGAPEVSGLTILSSRAYETLQCIALAHIPPGGAFENSAADRDLPRLFDTFLADEPVRIQRNAKLAILVVEYGPLRYDGRLTSFSNLEPEARIVHWDQWVTSPDPFRQQVSLAFRKFFSLAFYDHPDAWQHIGYHGPSYSPPPA